MKIYDVNIKKRFTDEDITDLIVDGIESGITYWALLHNDTEEFNKYYDKTELATSEIVADIILNGGTVKITDMEECEDPKYDLTLERFLVGIEKCINNLTWDGDMDSFDSDVTDVIIQYAVFDDLIFG